MRIGVLNTIVVFLGVVLGGPGANRQGVAVVSNLHPSRPAALHVKGSARARGNETVET